MSSTGQLDLLRTEYLALQQRCEETQRLYESLRVGLSEEQTAQAEAAESLIGQLVAFTRKLLETHIYSDIVFLLDDKSLKSHRFLLSCRSALWRNLTDCNELTIEDVSYSTFLLIYRWLYTDEIDLNCDDNLLIEIAQAALRYKLTGLSNRCISNLLSRLNSSNCVSIYELAEREQIEVLRTSCATIVAEQWDRFTATDFAKLSAPLLYRLLKGHSKNLLHAIVELARDDVLFLFFMEFDKKLAEVVNETTSNGESPLELSLRLGYTNIAKQLVEKGAVVDLRDAEDNTVLMRMIRNGNVAGADFLARHGANLKATNSRTGFTLLHHAAESIQERNEVAQWIEIMKDRVSINDKDNNGRSALALSILRENADLFFSLLRLHADTNIQDSEERTPLYLALFEKENANFVRELIGHEANVNAVVQRKPLICHAADMEYPDDSLRIVTLLIEQKANVNLPNVSDNKTALHIALDRKTNEIVQTLLESGAAVDVKDSEGETSLHKAVRAGELFTQIIVNHAKDIDCSVKNKNGTTALRLALNAKDYASASLLVKAGADVFEKGRHGRSLLYEAIEENDDATAVFLLNNGGIDEESGPESWLEMASKRGLTQTVKTLCSSGISINVRTQSGKGYTVLKGVLEKGHYECAKLLVHFGIDLDSWTETEDGEQTQTLLHLMMDLGNQQAAIFLIENGCDVNAKKKYRKEEDDDFSSPVHMAVAWGQTEVLKALVKAGANLNVQDSDGRTACHVAVREKHHDALKELLAAEDVTFVSMRDKFGHTTLSQAIANRDHESANLIVNRVPHAALQTNGNGENLLHVAVKSGDLEGVLFLLATHVDVSAVTSDSSRRTALHLAAVGTNEMITRNLLLAGCPINTKMEDGSTALHVAVTHHRTEQCYILLDNGADPNIADDQGNNVLHLAVKSGAIDCVQALLADGRVTTQTVNKKGQSALHLCAQLSQDKLPKRRTIGELCDMLIVHEEKRRNVKDLTAYLECRDLHGNTPLLLAYISANAAVCRQLLKRGTSMGAKNAEGISMFTYETPTKQLLFSLLESLEREPKWSDCETCDCGTKFSITQRKHHCRHCGRVSCSKCTEIQMPIMKFGEEKKVRVCTLCSQILTVGVARR